MQGRSLSQGQRQLLGLARALLLDRPLLLLDEANASVDEETEATMDEAVAAFTSGRVPPGPGCRCYRRTLLVVAHRLTGVMSLDQVGVSVAVIFTV